MPFFRNLIGLLLLSSPWCCAEPKSAPTHSGVDVVEATVALVGAHDGAFCAGVWVKADKVLTASHCVIDEDTDTELQTVQIKTKDGFHTKAQVTKVDRRRDLALLSVYVMPVHATSPIATTWNQGEPLSIVGHPGGEEWVWMRGYLEKWLMHDSPEAEDEKMGMLRVEAPVWYGNSGGGAFDENGALVGIASMRSSQQPEVGLFVAPDEIAGFLAGT